MKILKITGSSLLLSSALIITGCSSDDGGGVGKATVPKDAIPLTAANAETVISKSFTATDVILAKGTSATTTIPSEVVDQVLDGIRSNFRSATGADMVSGVAFNYTRDCATGQPDAIEGDLNTKTDKGNETATDDGSGGGTYKASGTSSMVECDEGNGVTLDGKVSYTWSEVWGYDANQDYFSNYSSKVSGSVTMTPNGSTTPIDLTNLVMNREHNGVTNDYTITKMQYTYNPGTDGFALNMTTTIEGNDNACNPTAGVVEISGANKSKVRITYSDTGVLVEVDENGDGTFAEVTTTFFACV
ncbi:MAG: hypothetical protein OEM07_01925 [Gammaproteobacteria bacterium]|nr:hypothetical protein [Gammaproteobacteria bacterium]